MAGISNPSLLEAMLAQIRHRGPDDSGIFAATGPTTASHVAIGNNRLKILDLSDAGHQPMSTPDGSVWVVHNGEIFNFQELRCDLERSGCRFRSQTDTEVLPYLYQKYGVRMVDHIRGMFAVAVWDARENQLVLFRDRTGIKPLYYVHKGETLYFASEIKALLACPEITAALDLRALEQYLALLYVPNPGSLFKGINKLAPGHMLRWKAGTIHIEQYWDLRFSPINKESEPELAAELQRRLIASVKRQLISDVPVGFFLSGGLDSSALVACAAKSHASLSCYSISYANQGHMEQSADDPKFARLVAEKFGAKFREIPVEPDVCALLPKVIWHLDEPVADPAAIATYLICQAAKPEVTVLISGQGADEILAGYRVHLFKRLTGLARFLPRAFRGRFVPRLLRFLARNNTHLPGLSPGLVLGFTRYFEKLLLACDLPAPDQYGFARSYLTPPDIRELLSTDCHQNGSGGSGIEHLMSLFQRIAHEDFTNQMLYVDAKTFLPDLNLAYSDRLSMASSVEVRVPFLDEEVLEFVLRLPPQMKIRWLSGKYLLRKAMEGALPSSIIGRRKAGFGLPIRHWIRTDLREMVRDLLSPQRLRNRGLFNPAVVARIIQQNEAGEKDFTYTIWGLLSLEVWHDTFRQRKHPEGLATIKQQATV